MHSVSRKDVLRVRNHAFTHYFTACDIIVKQSFTRVCRIHNKAGAVDTDWWISFKLGLFFRKKQSRNLFEKKQIQILIIFKERLSGKTYFGNKQNQNNW